MSNETELMQLWTRHLRLNLLTVMSELPAGRGNLHLLGEAAGMRGTLGSSDQARMALDWLAEQGLVATVASDVWELTEKGQEVVELRQVSHHHHPFTRTSP